MINKPLSRLAVPVLALPRPAKRFVAVLVDSSLCVLTVWLAYYLRLGEFVALSGNALVAVVVSIAIALPIFIVSGLYRAIFRYSGWPALMAVARAVGIYGLLYASVFTAIGVAAVPRTVGIIQPILLLLFVGASRALARSWLGDQYQYILKLSSRPKALIYGAGSMGRKLAAVISNSPELNLVGYLDDDDRLHGHVLDGQPIFDPGDLSGLVSALNVTEVLLALPSIDRRRRNEILARIRDVQIAVRTMPSETNPSQGKVSISDLRELDVDDLLGRETITPNQILLARNIADKVVLVTGAGGAVGSELCRQVLGVRPRKLLLVEQSELSLQSIHRELADRVIGRGIKLVPLLASVQDNNRMREIMSTWMPDTVYHAAAYKHVQLAEHNPGEGIKNNVLGTLKAAEAAADNNVADFVLISTEKAARPTNIMDTSKRLAELVLQGLATTNSGTRFSAVRFGDASVAFGASVARFRQQVRDGGPITLSHQDATSRFMTLSEAAQLVIQAGGMATGGDIFVLDMGPSVKLMDVARRMIELAGLTVKDDENLAGDIEIRIAGLQPGDNLHDDFQMGEKPKPTSHPKIAKVHEECMTWGELEAKLDALEMALEIDDAGVVRLMMQQLVSGCTPNGDIMDWVFLESEAEAELLGSQNRQSAPQP